MNEMHCNCTNSAEALSLGERVALARERDGIAAPPVASDYDTVQEHF
jgi:hypothetical protein